MRKQIFQAIQACLSERVPQIQSIDLWNENMTEDATYPCPAVFIEFETIEWRQQNNSVRRGNIAVRLHVLTQYSNNNDNKLDFFDLLDNINAAMHGLRGENFSGFLHTMSITNHNYAQHIECIERYVTSAQDVSTLLRQGVSICSGLDIVLRD